jgi:hypothetical protein
LDDVVVAFGDGVGDFVTECGQDTSRCFVSMQHRNAHCAWARDIA